MSRRLVTIFHTSSSVNDNLYEKQKRLLSGPCMRIQLDNSDDHFENVECTYQLAEVRMILGAPRQLSIA